MAARVYVSLNHEDEAQRKWFELLAKQSRHELHTFERTTITLRSDIWSFGMLMFELLFLRTPYEHERVELYDIARLVERGVAPQMADSERAAQPAFQPLIRTLVRCFSASPAERPNAQRLSSSLAQLRKVVVSK